MDVRSAMALGTRPAITRLRACLSVSFYGLFRYVSVCLLSSVCLPFSTSLSSAFINCPFSVCLSVCVRRGSLSFCLFVLSVSVTVCYLSVSVSFSRLLLTVIIGDLSWDLGYT